ncbi:HD domain-containing phosphohydrolase [Desulfatitalea alkaliphila]|uniref:Response regulator n=1 Tax=Desulfatitalea alkaliphila TaxID=2929485 RepID=A0AA41R7Q4_9BACT|nr:HD domain-containing phosphohydrolase [Desulfatitalea alkaliphila]MCJ8503103.1 response regulator [Desulfatitalea alkaliphila]
MQNDAKETILFVDDEQSIIDIAHTYFTAKGYNVLTAENGRQALDVMGSHRIDCCFTDINMPEMDGLALAEHIRRQDSTIPVIVMTGYPSLDNTIQTLKNGVVDFLVKPVNLHQMELCVQRVMRERRLFIENLMLSKELEGKAKIEQLNTELLYKVEELNILNRILNDFSSLRESSDVFQQLVDMAVEIVSADAACFYLVNDSAVKPMPIALAGDKWVAGDGRQAVSRQHGSAASVLHSPDDPKLYTLVREVLNDDRPLMVANNNGGSQRLPRRFRSCMLVPLKIRARVLGVLMAAVCDDGRRYNEKDLYYLDFMAKKASTSIENLALYENIYNNLLSTLYAFVKAIEARDPYTQQHSSRVTHLAVTLAKELGCSEEEQQILNVAGLLHDIGKIGIRDDILLKPGRLSDEEFDVIRQHPVIGFEIMGHLGLWTREKQIVRAHHERFDGKGYPDGLQGRQIPLLARILSVADVYDAIASDRAYRARMPESQILDIMYGGAGTQFDPAIIDVFRNLYESGALETAIAANA